jgi:ketosteroid isomerase-like protein
MDAIFCVFSKKWRTVMSSIIRRRSGLMVFSVIMRAPCCDVFNLKDGKIVSFHCYPFVLFPSSWTDA